MTKKLSGRSQEQLFISNGIKNITVKSTDSAVSSDRQTLTIIARDDEKDCSMKSE